MAAASDAISAPYVEVAVPVPLRQTFTYGVPGALEGVLRPGARVAVSFGRRNVPGIVLGPAEAPEAVKRIKPVLGLLDPEPLFDAELLGFLRAAASYYLHPIGEVLRSAAPALPADAIKRLTKGGTLDDGALRGTKLSTRKTLFVLSTGTPAPEEVARLGKRQQEVLQRVQSAGECSLDTLRAVAKGVRGIVRTLESRGLVRSEQREVSADPFFAEPVELSAGPTPNRAQLAAIETLTAALPEGGGFLLHGVTGSGKTEVYLRLIEAARQQGKGALMLVPEIALTPQLVGRFRARFGDAIAVIHSELSDRARNDAWRALRAGRISVAVGARSALFAPVRDLGVVVVDEEHDASFKQEEGFRYHGRDMALLRAHRAGAVCVLGSATPALETRALSQRDRIGYLRLEHRATSQPLPDVEVIDLNRHRGGPATAHRLLSMPLERALQACLQERGQAILFLNRRGFSPALRCEKCGEIQQCPSCSVALTAHRASARLQCHYCDFVTTPARGCSHCGDKPLLELGLGTEQLEALVQERFPEARVARLDRDTASGRGIEAVINKLRRHEIDILVGTQMVTKGHDLPGVTLVGVVLADQSLAFPDFRASERTFQLLAQVAGRAGRGDREGRVLLQTYQPEHPAVRHARTHDYDGFAEAELRDRQELGYPPSGYLAAVRVDANQETVAREAAAGLARWIGQHPAMRRGDVNILGPAPAPIARIRGRHRFRFMLRAAERPPLRAVLEAIAARVDDKQGTARVFVDVDPVNML